MTTKTINYSGLEEYTKKVKDSLLFNGGEMVKDLPSYTPAQLNNKMETVSVKWSAQKYRGSSERNTGTFNATKIMLTDTLCLLCATVEVPAQTSVNTKSDVQMILNWSDTFYCLGGTCNYSFVGNAQSRTNHMNVHTNGVDGYTWSNYAMSNANIVVSFLLFGTSIES